MSLNKILLYGIGGYLAYTLIQSLKTAIPSAGAALSPIGTAQAGPVPSYDVLQPGGYQPPNVVYPSRSGFGPILPGDITASGW
jgi:hypothetical protein